MRPARSTSTQTALRCSDVADAVIASDELKVQMEKQVISEGGGGGVLALPRMALSMMFLPVTFCMRTTHDATDVVLLKVKKVVVKSCDKIDHTTHAILDSNLFRDYILYQPDQIKKLVKPPVPSSQTSSKQTQLKDSKLSKRTTSGEAAVPAPSVLMPLQTDCVAYLTLTLQAMELCEATLGKPISSTYVVVGHQDYFLESTACTKGCAVSWQSDWAPDFDSDFADSFDVNDMEAKGECESEGEGNSEKKGGAKVPPTFEDKKETTTVRVRKTQDGMVFSIPVVDLHSDVSIHVMSVGRISADKPIAFASIPLLSLVSNSTNNNNTNGKMKKESSNKNIDRNNSNNSIDQYIELLPVSSPSASTITIKGRTEHSSAGRVTFPKYRPASYIGNEPPPQPASPFGILKVTVSLDLTTNGKESSTTAKLGQFVSRKLLGASSASVFHAYTHRSYAALDESKDDSAQAIVASASRLVRALARFAGSNSPFIRSLNYIRGWHSIPLNIIALVLLYHTCFIARWAHLPIIMAFILVACGRIDSWETRSYAMWGPALVVEKTVVNDIRTDVRVGRKVVHRIVEKVVKSVLHVKQAVSSRVICFTSPILRSPQCGKLVGLVKVVGEAVVPSPAINLGMRLLPLSVLEAAERLSENAAASENISDTPFKKRVRLLLPGATGWVIPGDDEDSLNNEDNEGESEFVFVKGGGDGGRSNGSILRSSSSRRQGEEEQPKERSLNVLQKASKAKYQLDKVAGTLARTAKRLEQAVNLLNWSDPVITPIGIALLLCISIVLSLLVSLLEFVFTSVVDPSVLVFVWAISFLFIPVEVSASMSGTFKFPKAGKILGMLGRGGGGPFGGLIGLAESLGNVMERVPDEAEMAHRCGFEQLCVAG